MARKSNYRCHYPRCTQPPAVIWLGKPACDKHWLWICDVSREKAYKKFRFTEKEKKIIAEQERESDKERKKKK